MIILLCILICTDGIQSFSLLLHVQQRSPVPAPLRHLKPECVKTALPMASPSELHFPEENLIATAAENSGFFITRPGDTLKGGRYKVIRKLGSGRCSTIFLVEDLQWQALSSHQNKYLAAKVLSVAATNALRAGIIHELDALQATSKWPEGQTQPFSLPFLLDHFAQKGPHGVHYSFLTRPLAWNVHAFRASAPTGRLSVHIVKTIVYYVADAVRELNLRGFIHADIKADNILLSSITTAEIEERIAAEPPVIYGIIEFNGVEYPILRSQPLPPNVTWDITPFITELLGVILCDLGSALWIDKPKPFGDIGAFALRAPENIVRAECGKEIDVWAIGCLAYELLAGQILFRPQPIPDLTPDQSLLLLQYALTGETLSKEVVGQSRLKDQYFDQKDILIKSNSNPYPRHTIKELLTQRCPELEAKRINAAANFITYCLRLNPRDRPTIKEVLAHRWLAIAYMGSLDRDD